MVQVVKEVLKHLHFRWLIIGALGHHFDVEASFTSVTPVSIVDFH